MELPFYAKESGKKEIVLTRTGLTNVPLATKGLIISKFEEGQDSEEEAMVSSSHMTLLSKTMQGSNDDDEVNESEEFDGKHCFLGSIAVSLE